VLLLPSLGVDESVAISVGVVHLCLYVSMIVTGGLLFVSTNQMSIDVIGRAWRERVTGIN
jgi:hypothetical protein